MKLFLYFPALLLIFSILVESEARPHYTPNKNEKIVYQDDEYIEIDIDETQEEKDKKRSLIDLEYYLRNHKKRGLAETYSEEKSKSNKCKQDCIGQSKVFCAGDNF
jgi:hypothetical protein